MGPLLPAQLPAGSSLPRSEAEEEDVAHCINKSPQCALLCPHVPWPARATSPGFSLLKQCSVMLCAHHCGHGQNSPSLKDILSKTGSFLHSQTLVFQQEQLPDFPCSGNHRAPSCPLCARHAVLMPTALGSACSVPDPRPGAGRAEDWECSIFSIGMHRQGRVNLWMLL